MFNSYAKNKLLNMLPQSIKLEIEGAVQGWILKDINQGVYKVGLTED